MTPEVPKIYYAHCPPCHKVGEFLKDDLETLEDGNLKYDCGCGLSQSLDSENLPKDERKAYQYTMANILQLNSRNSEYFQNEIENMQAHVLEISKRYSQLKLSNNSVNSLFFTLEKSVKDIIETLNNDDSEEAVKHAKYEAKDLPQILLKEQDRVSKDGKEIEKKAKSQHWSDFVEQVYKEDEATEAKSP